MPALYFPGRTVDLVTLSGEKRVVTITRILSITMSPVLEVQIRTPSESQTAILKLFDRRFGEPRERHPYNHAAEIAWQDCVRSGLAEELLTDLRHHDDMIKKKRLKNDDEDADDDDDDDDDVDVEDEDDPKEHEAVIYHDTQKYYINEIRAYTKLESLQGKRIPRFLGSVIDNSPQRPADLPAVYFQVKGILLEYIPSFTLSDMISHIPKQPHVWTSIVESAIRVVIEVNRAGVVHFDCQPRNVLVARTGQGSYRPFLIDFAQCAFREDHRDTPDMFDERGFGYLTRSSDNNGAIAVLMIQRVARTTPYQLHIQESLYLD